MPTSTTSDDFDDVDDTIIDIEAIQDHGINASDIAKLRGAGFNTVMAANSAMKKTLANIRGFSETKVEKIREALKKCVPEGSCGVGFVTGLEVKAQRKKVISISTGSKALDNALGGGFQTKSLCEIFGEYRCGKTQLAHTMIVLAQMPKGAGGAGGKVAMIDTEGTFRPERITSIARRFNMDPDVVLNNFSYSRVYNSEQQMEQLDALSAQLKDGQYRLIVVDSIMNCFRTDFHGRGELAERQQKLNEFLHKCTQMAEEFNLCVLMVFDSDTFHLIDWSSLFYQTNQVQSDPGNGGIFAGGIDGRKAVGGHVLAHASSTRVLVRKGRGEERVARIVDSPDVAESEAIYIITEGGIDDVAKA